MVNFPNKRRQHYQEEETFQILRSVSKLCSLGGIKSLVSRYIEGYSFWGIRGPQAETANRAESGQLQFLSEPSEILNIRSSSTLETVAFSIP